MKKTLILLILIAISTNIFAQRDETLFKRGQRGGFFFTPWLTEYGQFGDDTRPSFGGGVGVIAGDFFLGAYGLGNTDYDFLVSTGTIEDINLAHGGLWLGYVPMQHKAFHPYTNLRVGWGAVGIDETNIEQRRVDGVNVITPEIGLEVNVFRWLRVAGTGGYRWVNDVETAALGSNYFNGWTAGINVRIGWFGRDRNWREREEEKRNKG